MQQDLRRTRFVRIVLTDEQMDEVEQRTGRRSEAIELTVAELEARVVPRVTYNHNETLAVEELEERVVPRLGANHNETMLADG